ncbi:MAG TPA: SDR family oxidoreductase [Acidobacteriota bacterium]|nr:SDR family oxidoreductase [Acidobacteriota bacterium]
MSSESRESKVALVTGGVRGIGRAVSVALARCGWSVAANYRTSESDAAALESELRAMGVKAECVRADISDPSLAAELVRHVEAEFGRIDALINCAGTYRRIHLLEETIEGWHAMFENNLHPIFYLSHAAAAGMMARKWGRIVTFSMANADQHVGQPFITAHYIAKAGVLILTRTLAKVLAPHGITANSISPGFIETGGAPLEDLSNTIRNIPAGYVGHPRDAASVVCFLLSEEARYINGTNIHVSGAWGI